MAAYDLNVSTPGMVQIPNDFHKSSQNLMQFMRMQREQRNQQDKLALEKRKADDIARFRAGQLDIDQQRTNNTLEDLRVDNTLAQSKFNWDKGDLARQEEARLRLNQAFQGASDGAYGSLSESFQLTPETVEAYKKDSNYLSKSPEEQAAFDAKVLNTFKEKAYQQYGRQATEQMLRRKYADTHGTPEQIEYRIQKELDSRFKPKDDQLFNTLVSLVGGGRNGSSVGTNVGLDDTGELRATLQYADEFEKAHDVESGNGKSLFNPLSWLDVGDTDLTQENLNVYQTEMANRGFNQVEALAALKSHLDGDTVGPGFDEFLSGKVTKDFESVLNSATAIRKLKAARQKQGNAGVGGNTQFLSSLISARENNGAPTTAAQRLEIIRGMLGSKIQQAQAQGNGNKGLDDEMKALIEEQAKLAPQVEAEQAAEQQVPQNTVVQQNPVSNQQLWTGRPQGPLEKFLQEKVKDTSDWAAENNVLTRAWKNRHDLESMSPEELKLIISRKSGNSNWKSTVKKAEDLLDTLSKG